MGQGEKDSSEASVTVAKRYGRPWINFSSNIW